jgi:S-adenosylmethionine hydrolase
MIPAPGIIALLTDYGLSGPYVGALKAVILGINPAATIFDLSHGIEPQAIEEGAFVLGQVAPYLPEGTVCVAVVDPGVGTARRAIAIRTSRGMFVGPDNGLLSAALDDKARGAAREPTSSAVPVPAGALAVELTNPAYFRHPVSATFHGRDIFAAVAAHLSLAVPLEAFGPALSDVQAFPPWRAVPQGDGSFASRVVYTDRFGNLVTDVRASDLPGTAVRVRIADRELSGLQRTFLDGPELVVYAGSSGFLEIARRNGSAADALGVIRGESVLVMVSQ